MVSVRAYVRSLLKQGYSEGAIRQVLVRSGYSDRDIALAFRRSYLFVFVIAAVLVVIAVLLIFPLMFKPEVVEVKAFVSGVSGEVVGSVRFDSSSDRRVSLKANVVLIDSSGSVVVSKQFVEQFIGSVVIPVSFSAKGLSPGRYSLEVSSFFKGKRLSDSVDVVVESVGLLPDVSPVVSFVQECPSGCNDFNACTSDSCVDGGCVNVLFSPCCGNRECESSENPASCPGDCVVRPRKTYAEVVDEAKAVAVADPEEGSRMCASILVVPQLDLCFSEIAKISRNSGYCAAIRTVVVRDSCYAGLAQFSPGDCDKIFDEYVRTACYTFSANSVQLSG
ncbi:hypothetical protein HY486_03465 [Candidatus Woesearchaeota archaeon]|nr:hypothetical protein [Candidatus Woesearchaeota archaeon]